MAGYIEFVNMYVAPDTLIFQQKIVDVQIVAAISGHCLIPRHTMEQNIVTNVIQRRCFSETRMNTLRSTNFMGTSRSG